MALSPQLKQFESSGVYRLEFDKSQTTSIPTETIRLVVGHSRKGPYNSPVLVNDTETFVQVFGGIDKKLERKGFYFHRSALEALSRGSILALNLNPQSYDDQDQEIDRVEYFKPSTNASEEGLTAQFDNMGYSQTFNTDKFWTPEVESLLKSTDNESETSNYAISFVNIKQDPITVVVKQSNNTDGFNLTAREWYGEGSVPEGIAPHEFIADYMVDVYVFKGLFDSNEYNTDPVYGNYFDENGILKDQLTTFSNLREITLESQYTGCLIPEFKDLEGNNMYIENIINAEARRTGLFCAVNEDALNQMDFVGQQFNIYEDYELLSHIIEQKNPELYGFSGEFGSNGYPIRVFYDQENKLEIKNIADQANRDALLDDFNNNVIFLESQTSGEYTQIDTIDDQEETDDNDNGLGTYKIILTTNENIDRSKYETFQEPTSGQPSFDETYINSITVSSSNESVEIDYDGSGFNFTANGLVADNYIPSNESGKMAKIKTVDNNTTDEKLIITVYSDQELNPDNFPENTPSNIKLDNIQELTNTVEFNGYTIKPNDRVEMFPGSKWDFVSEGNGSFTFTLEQDSTQPDPEESGDGLSNIEVGMYVPIQNSDKLAKIQRKSREFVPASDNQNDKDKYIYRFKCHLNVPAKPEYALRSFDAATTSYKTFALPGATISEKSISDVIDMIRPGNSLSNTLADRDSIEYRYIVDTFGSYDNGVILNKSEFTQLAQKRKNITALLNAPMINEFKKSSNPSFKNELTGEFDVRYIRDGGNLKLNPTRLFTLPSLNEGSDYGVFYSPGLRVVENGKDKIVPPAAFVSNNYIDKYSQSVPWAIVAGTRRGVVSGNGVQNVEYPYDKDNRKIVEPFGLNPIVFESGVGLVIKGNKTAQQSIKSALSSAHVREVLIYIENGLAEILSDYTWEFNTAQTRLEIKTLADNFLESVRQGDGVYNYQNRMDKTNNTNEVIDQNMGILDTFVEPVKGLEILVSRTTILNTGDIESGNFSVNS